MLHAGAWLRQKVLHDDFLYMTTPATRFFNDCVFDVRITNSNKRSNAIGAGLAKAYQDSGRKRNV